MTLIPLELIVTPDPITVEVNVGVSDNVTVAPIPDADYSVELHYNYRPNSLTTVGNDNQTWLSDNAPNAMLYGSLVDC